MNYGMDYQGDGGGAGGGFSDRSFGGGGGGGFGGGTAESPSQSQRPRRAYGEQTLIPVTIGMTLQSFPSTDDDSGSNSLQCLPDGRKVAMVVLVGAVRSVNDQSTNVVYELEDGTGLIDVKQWLDDNDPTIMSELRAQTLKEHIYIKVIGQIKDYDGKKLIVANSVRPLSTGNELSHHMLQVAYTAEQYKRADSIVAQPMNIGSPMMTTSNGSGTAAVLGPSGGNSLRDQVLEFFKREGEYKEEGVSVQRCMQMVSPPQSESAIRQCVDQLQQEGNLYSTIDDDHFKFAM